MAYVIIAVCFGLAGGIIGKIKGSSFFLWFLISGVVPSSDCSPRSPSASSATSSAAHVPAADA